jgi:hypothetical protein
MKAKIFRENPCTALPTVDEKSDGFPMRRSGVSVEHRVVLSVPDQSLYACSGVHCVRSLSLENPSGKGIFGRLFGVKRSKINGVDDRTIPSMYFVRGMKKPLHEPCKCIILIPRSGVTGAPNPLPFFLFQPGARRDRREVHRQMKQLVSHPQKAEKRGDATPLATTERLYYCHWEARSAGRHLI